MNAIFGYTVFTPASSDRKPESNRPNAFYHEGTSLCCLLQDGGFQLSAGYQLPSDIPAPNSRNHELVQQAKRFGLVWFMRYHKSRITIFSVGPLPIENTTAVTQQLWKMTF